VAMTKSELVARVATKYPNLSQRDVERVVNSILNEVSNALSHSGRVELRGFGAFSVRRREPRRARNPKNGKEVFIGERFAIYFRTGKQLRERINKAAK
jgi:integration host factor subunit beta